MARYDIVINGGTIVAPGVVDLHTRYDSQLFWDLWCTMSGWHGVKTGPANFGR